MTAWSIGVALMVTVVAAPPTLAAGPASLRAVLTDLVGSFPGQAAVVVSDPRRGFRYAYGEDRIVPSASLYKLGLMVEAYRQEAASLVSLDDMPVQIVEDDLSGDGYFTPADVVLSLREALTRAITVSDNSSAHALLRLFDPRAVNATMGRLGLATTRINSGLPPDEQSAPLNTTTARDMERFFSGLLTGSVVSAPASREMVAMLERQQINDRLPAGLPPGTRIAHKTGNLPGVAHDAGIVFTSMGPRVIVVLATDFASYDDVVSLNESIAAAVSETPLDAIAARYALLSPHSLTLHAGQPVLADVRVENSSLVAWSDQTVLAIRWRNAAGRAADRDDLQWSIGGPVDIGGTRTIHLEVPAPTAPGAYVLEIEAVDLQQGRSGNRLPIVVVLLP